MKFLLFAVLLFSSCGSAFSTPPECDQQSPGPPYPCSQVGAQAKKNALDDFVIPFAERDRDNLLDNGARNASLALGSASTDADRAQACAEADYWCAFAVCSFYGRQDVSEWECLVGACRAAIPRR